MRRAIVGANSRVGRMLRAQWSSLPDVYWIARSGTDRAWAIEDGIVPLARHLDGVDQVVCLAGATPRSGSDFSLNISIAEAVVAAAPVGCHVVLASSAAVYSGGVGNREGRDENPANDYGRSKLAMEQGAAAAAAVRGVRLSCLRLGNVVGADMLFDMAAQRKHIRLDTFADGSTPRRSYVDADFLALGLKAVFSSGPEAPAILNFASDPPLEMQDVLNAAGLAYENCPAGPMSRAEVSMDMARLFAIDPALSKPRDAIRVISEWQKSGGVT